MGPSRGPLLDSRPPAFQELPPDSGEKCWAVRVGCAPQRAGEVGWEGLQRRGSRVCLEEQ